MIKGEERRKVMEEHSSSIRSIRLRAYCEQRSEAYWKAMRTGSNLDWQKYEDITRKFVRLCHGTPKKGGR